MLFEVSSQNPPVDSKGGNTNSCCASGFGSGDRACDGTAGSNVAFGGSGFRETILEVDGTVLVAGLPRADWE